MLRIVLVALAIVLCTAPAVAAGPQRLTIPTIANVPPLDPRAPASAWEGAAPVTLSWDVQHQRPATEPATARVATDGADVLVRFDVPQREPIVAEQHTNDVGDGTDDEVWIDLWPNGLNGFSYEFAATPSGTHYQYSSENTAYAPTWQSQGAGSDGGYTVTMRIPLRLMRSSGAAGGWKAQFVRVVRSTGERQIWSYDGAQTNADDVVYAGALAGITSAVAVRPKPRLAVYGLGSAGSTASGLTTSRTGADVSVPVTATSSLFATIHPDFSNVEVDQQTIAPTAFARRLTEVRPFFAQAANYLNPFGCSVCPPIREAYTPAIPTPRDGYAFEGTQGPVSFVLFDAVGAGRNDGAAAATVRWSDNRWRLGMQEAAATRPGSVDHVVTTGLSYTDNKHISAQVNYGTDAGTSVLDGRQAQRYDANVYWYSSTFGAAFSTRKIGAYYNPVDGFVEHPDIAGYGLYENKVWSFDEKTVLNSIQVGTYVSRYHDRTGRLDETANVGWIDVLTRNLVDVQWNFGSSYLGVSNGIITPVSQSGGQITWHSGSDNKPGCNECHGSSATPTVVGFTTGRFGPGRLDAWTRNSTMRAGMRATLSLELDDTRDYLDSGKLNVQWLQRASYTFAAGANSGLSVGLRRITGTAPVVDAAAPPAYVKASNLSFAYHRRLPHDELYAAYGDASRLNTAPQLILKLVHYFGAEKGT